MEPRLTADNDLLIKHFKCFHSKTISPCTAMSLMTCTAGGQYGFLNTISTTHLL